MYFTSPGICSGSGAGRAGLGRGMAGGVLERAGWLTGTAGFDFGKLTLGATGVAATVGWVGAGGGVFAGRIGAGGITGDVTGGELVVAEVAGETAVAVRGTIAMGSREVTGFATDGNEAVTGRAEDWSATGAGGLGVPERRRQRYRPMLIRPVIKSKMPVKAPVIPMLLPVD